MEQLQYDTAPSPETDTLQKRFRRIRKQTEEICAPLEAEDYVVQPVVEVSPPKWHLGHTSWFFEQFVLQSHKKDYHLFHPEYAYLFNSYYESVGKRVIRTQRGNLTRPSVEEVYAYRRYINEQMEEYLQQTSVNADIRAVIEMGLQHEQQHQELLVYDIKYILGTNPLFPPYKKAPAISVGNGMAPEPPAWLEVEEGLYSIGCIEPDIFCFDNERGVHKEYLHAFRIMDRLITSGEYLEFMEAGAYTDFRYWLQEGWEWVKQENIQAPFYWHKMEGEWHRYSLQGLEKLHLQAPLSHVSFYEADAFARWKGMRLPTEAEWEVACRQYSPQLAHKANLQANGLPEPEPAQQGNHQFYGDVWEWTASAYRPYPFYEAPEGALGEYNGKFMVNQMVLRGGSCATPDDHIRASYRNFFHPQLRWMFSGLRLAQHI